jgi:F5/8 type C domain-containing protein
MPGKPQPLDSRFAIANPDGTPTEYFIRWAQERQIDITAGVTVQIVQQLINEFGEDAEVVAGVDLEGGGPIGSDPVIDHIDSGVTPGTYGSAGKVPRITVNSRGHLEDVDEVEVEGGGSVKPTTSGPSGYLPSILPHKLWRLNITSNHGPSQVSVMLAEIQFRTNPGVYQLVGPGLAFANSTLDANVPARAFDNDPNSFWHTAGVIPGIIGYNYTTPISVQEVTIRARNGNGLAGSPKAFDVQWSEDGVTWTTEWSIADAGFTAEGQLLTFTSPIVSENVNYYPVLLNALNDVDTASTPPTDGQALAWDDAAQQWIPTTIEGGGGGGGGGGGAGNVLASARFNCANTALPVVAAGINVASIVKMGTGLYRVTFTNPISLDKVGFHGGGKWLVNNGRSQLGVSIERNVGYGLTTTYVDLTTYEPIVNNYFDCDDWFSFTLYDVSQGSGSGGGAGGGTAWKLLGDWSFATSGAIAAVVVPLTGMEELRIRASDVSTAAATWIVGDFSYDGGATWVPANLDFSKTWPTNGLIGVVNTGEDRRWYLHAAAQSAVRSVYAEVFGLGKIGPKYLRSPRTGFEVALNRSIPTHFRIAAGLDDAGGNSVFDAGSIQIYGLPNTASGGGGASGWNFKPPKAAYFPNIVTGPGVFTVTDDDDVGLRLRTEQSVAKVYVRDKNIAVPATSWSAIARLIPTLGGNAARNMSMVAGRAAHDTFAFWGWDGRGSGLHAMAYGINGYAGWESFVQQNTLRPEWFKMDYDTASGTMSYSFSTDGKEWVLGLTDNYDARFGGKPAFLGVAIAPEGSSGPIVTALSVPYWLDTAP